MPALRAAFGFTYFQGGILAFTAGGISAALQPVVGYVADRRGGRRPVLALGFLLYAVGMLALSLAGSYTGLLLAAVVLALASTTYHPQATTLIAHRFPQARGWASGIHGIGNSIGFALAPIIVATMAERLGWQQASLLLALPAAFGAVYIWTLVREPRGRSEPGLLAGITPAAHPADCGPRADRHRGYRHLHLATDLLRPLGPEPVRRRSAHGDSPDRRGRRPSRSAARSRTVSGAATCWSGPAWR